MEFRVTHSWHGSVTGFPWIHSSSTLVLHAALCMVELLPLLFVGTTGAT